LLPLHSPNNGVRSLEDWKDRNAGLGKKSLFFLKINLVDRKKVFIFALPNEKKHLENKDYE